MPQTLDYTFSVAPMMDWTDRHCRSFHRVLSKRALLWTEMVTANAVIHGDRERLIGFSEDEHPLVLQLGGSEPDKMAEAAHIAESYGYDEVNINCGCPSDRVQSGAFGACLMREPETVAACVSAIRAAVSIPVTVKCRIAIDDAPPRETLFNFVAQVADAGCNVFTVHARKAWLQGLSPKDNRNIPPLRYDDVYRLKQEQPELWIEINGGIKTLGSAHTQLQHVDAVMVGRAAYDTPYIFALADREIYGAEAPLTRHQVVTAMLPYIARWTERGTKLHSITRHMLQLFHGQPGSRAWKRHLTDHSCRAGAGTDVVMAAVAQVPEPMSSPTPLPL